MISKVRRTIPSPSLSLSAPTVRAEEMVRWEASTVSLLRGRTPWKLPTLRLAYFGGGRGGKGALTVREDSGRLCCSFQ